MTAVENDDILQETQVTVTGYSARRQPRPELSPGLIVDIALITVTIYCPRKKEDLGSLDYERIGDEARKDVSKLE